jgi:hypothetical protein
MGSCHVTLLSFSIERELRKEKQASHSEDETPLLLD